MYDTQIFASKEWADYLAALQGFAEAAISMLDHQIEINEAVVETMQLQKEVLIG